MKLAIFDMDGTLFDTRQANYLAYKKALNNFGFDVSKEYYFDFCNGKYYLDFLPKLVGENLDYVKNVHSQKQKIYEQFLGEVRPNTHLLCIIEYIRGIYKTSLVTSASRKNVEMLLDFFSVREFFDLIITSEDVDKKKPDPEGFLLAMRTIGASQKETMIFEDSPEGIAAAKKVGGQVFIVENGY